MAGHADIPPFQLQPVLSEIYHAKDLLDLSPPGPSSPPKASSPAAAAAGGLFASATSIAAAAGRRAAAVASAATATAAGTASSPAGPSTVRLRGDQSPARGTQSPDRSTTPVQGRAAAAPGFGSSHAEVRCVEGYGQNLYVGGSDGVVEWWVCDGGSSSQAEGWTLRHKHTLFPRRPVSKIILLPKVSRCFVLSDGTLHPLALPSLDVLPSTVIAPLRGVVSVVLNDEELDWGGPGGEERERGAEMTVVMVRRKGMAVYKLGARMQLVKEIPLPHPPAHHALSSTFLCAALPSPSPDDPSITTLNYAVIDLSDASLTEVLPVSQSEPGVADFDPNPNIVVIPGENEFLVTSFTGAGTIGIFLNGQGDPVRGTIDWEDHPLSITVESGYIIALLRSNIITIHTLSDLEKPVQTVSLDASFGAFGLAYSPYGISVRDLIRDTRMITTRMLLLGGKLAPPKPDVSGFAAAAGLAPKMEKVLSDQQSDAGLMIGSFSADDASPAAEDPPSGSGLTPPSSPPLFQKQPVTPPRSTSLLHAGPPKISGGPFSTTIAETLVLGPNAIMSIAPTPALVRVEAYLKDGRMDEAIAVVDEERRKGRRGEIDADKATHQGTLRLLHLMLGLHLFNRAMFERAGDYLLRGKIDPRLIVRSFTSLRGKTIGSAEEVEVYEGVKELLEGIGDIDAIAILTAAVADAVDRQLGTDTEGISESRVALQEALMESATSMLAEVLRKTRISRRKGGGGRGLDSRKIDIIIDTTLCKLLAEAGTTHELLATLAGPNDAVLSELEPFLSKRPFVLSTVMRQQGRTDRVLELLKGIAESPESDPLCPDPVGELAMQLENVSDPELFIPYALWVVGKDEEKGLTLLLGQGSHPAMKLDDAKILEQLREISASAADQYLEYVVVGKKSPVKALHEELLGRLIDRAEIEVRDDGVRYHLEELDSEYRLRPDEEPYCVFLADVAPDTPIKSLRLKLMLFLQGSPFYDLAKASARLKALVPPLKYESAVVLGRQGRNRQALQLLARDIGDGYSAQTYCTQGGEIIPPKIARRVAKKVPALMGWAALGEIGRKRRGAIDAAGQEGLVMELLGVYMRDGATTSKETAALLNAQAMHTDVLEVLKLMPDEWSLDVVSTFIQRSLRRQLHEKNDWAILKAIAAGQNLQVSEAHLSKMASIPPTVIHGPSPGESFASRPDEGSIAEKEHPHPLTEADLGAVGEKWTAEKDASSESGVVGGEETAFDDLEKSRSFFSPQGVEKELRDLGLDAPRSEVDTGDDDLR